MRTMCAIQIEQFMNINPPSHGGTNDIGRACVCVERRAGHIIFALIVLLDDIIRKIVER